jgi:hypothetical protein
VRRVCFFCLNLDGQDLLDFQDVFAVILEMGWGLCEESLFFLSESGWSGFAGFSGFFFAGFLEMGWGLCEESLFFLSESGWSGFAGFSGFFFAGFLEMGWGLCEESLFCQNWLRRFWLAHQEIRPPRGWSIHPSCGEFVPLGINRLFSKLVLHGLRNFMLT